MEVVVTDAISTGTSIEAGSLDFHKSEISDKQLVEAVLAGKQEEYRYLVLRYQDQVFAMIMRQVGERDVAEDLAQDTFLRAYRGLKQFRNDAKFSTWLIRIALNVCNSYFSSRRYREKQKTVVMENQLNNTTDTTNSDQGYSAEQIERLRVAVQKLSPTLQSVLVICGLEKKSYEEAARILEIPVGTVRSRLNRARERLQQLYFEVSR